MELETQPIITDSQGRKKRGKDFLKCKLLEGLRGAGSLVGLIPETKTLQISWNPINTQPSSGPLLLYISTSYSKPLRSYDQVYQQAEEVYRDPNPKVTV